MDLNDDLLNLDLEPSATGRMVREDESLSRNSKRRRETEANGTAFAEGNPLTDIFGSSPVPFNPPRSRRSALWSDESDSDNWQHLRDLDSARGSRAKSNVRPSTGIQLQDWDSESDVIPAIPDLEKIQDEEFVQETADAPSVMVNKLVSYQELEKDILKHSAFSSLDSIDLSVLIKRLVPEDDVKEEDLPWTWDNLISDAASKLSDHSDVDSTTG